MGAIITLTTESGLTDAYVAVMKVVRLTPLKFLTGLIIISEGVVNELSRLWERGQSPYLLLR